MKCLLGIDPEKTQKCKPSECASCGWEAAEAARRREYVKKRGAHLDSGEKCECRAEEIETVHSQKCACGITEQDVESGWECPLDNPNETVKRCEDCAFAKETD